MQAAVVGGVSGAIAGVVGPEAGPVARIAVGALASGAGQVAGNAISGKPLLQGVGTAVAVGAITGGVAEGVGAVFSGSTGDAVDSAVTDVTGGCGLSFRADTVVATSKGERAIGTLKVGERVWAYNPQTKKIEPEPIQHIWLNHDTDLVDVTLVATVKDAHGKSARQTERIHTNEKHPFLTQEKGFIPVSQLKPGMHVLEANGSYGVVAKLVIVSGAMWMYNLTVAQDHTYAVGFEQWIVHNCPQSGTSGNSGSIQSGNAFHYDELNGGIPGTQGGPSQLQSLYPHTEFRFAPRGVSGPDVQVVGGLHPSDPLAYPGTNWPVGSDTADFKPNWRQFNRDISSGKLPPDTVPIIYDRLWFVITSIGRW